MKGPASLPWPSKTIQEFVQDYLPRSTHFFFKYLVKIESVQISGIFQDKDFNEISKLIPTLSGFETLNDGTLINQNQNFRINSSLL